MKLPESDILAARLLIVDDQAANVRLLERMLGESGYSNVASTMDPLQACSLHQQHDYDLILLDLQMPGLNGFEVMAELSASAGDSYLPVIVLTAQPQHKLQALQAGAKDFISKPFDLLEIKTRIRNMLEVRLLYRRLEAHNEVLEQAVLERTAELRESEARYRSLTALASDWHWEQDKDDNFTNVTGPVLEMLGLCTPALDSSGPSAYVGGWNEAERGTLLATIAARQPFLDFAISRVDHNGEVTHYRVSGEPMFTQSCKFIGYRGVGVEMNPPAMGIR
ncbi:response regulator [Hydrogenophaga sp. PAMC20947]|uniref:response regulator n=1 Tax=Hydrogenophaga sp. PAMC20947 TaxID=2565558 RepID=UPI00109E288F|nr:response regulator [Hydrogenophaga sp. PAMC20947]QCB45557.1 response regulator [Hydrogenophaga sp. PAMC20947]